MIIGLLEEYGKSKYVCMLILFLLEILEKHAFIMYGVITQALCRVKIQMILLEKFLGLFYIVIKKS